MNTDKSTSSNSEKNAERSPLHFEFAEAGQTLSEQAFDLMKSMKFELPAANPSGNSEIANMLGGFGLFDGGQQQNQGDMQNPSMDQQPNPFNPFSQGQSDSQGQGPDAQNPIEQALQNLLTNQNASAGQEAAMGIGEDVMSGLMSAATGGDSYSPSSDGSSTDGSDNADGSDDGSTPDDTTDQTQNAGNGFMPDWMVKYAMSS